MKDGGSTRHLEYNDSEADSITVDFLIKQAIRVFFPEGKSKFGTVQDMDVELGNFAQEKIAEFKNTDGEKCTFKEYLKDRGLFASKFYVYLMTTLTEDENTLENVVKQTNVVTSSSFTRNKEEWQSSGSSRSSTRNTRNELADFQIQQIITSTPKNIVTQDSTKNQAQKYGPALGENQDTLCTAETIGEHFLSITYEEVKESSYSAEVVIKTLSNSRRDCYDLNCLSEPLTREIDINDYIPIEHGYTITEIFKAGKCFLKREYTTSEDNQDCGTFEYIYPEAMQQDQSGLILHHPSEIWGYDEDTLVIGVVASCHMKANAHYIWYRNDTVIQQGSTFCCITINEPGVYSVEVQCGEERDVSAPIFIRPLNMSESHPTSNGTNLGMNTNGRKSNEENDLSGKESGAPLTVIDKEEIIFSTRDEIGRGSFGVVYKGSWAGTQVALKHTKVRNAKRVWSAVQNELRVHSMVRHPNIVQIMGVSLLKNSLYIVSEYIEGLNLDELLFGDSENPNSFDVETCDKFAIGKQICQAVAYLHNLKPPVIHRDIKPANVLVAKETHITKLCDMGLSKLKSHQSLSQTTNVGIPGTPHYMAPECLVERKRASVHSDMWSLGCTLVELLSGQDCWEDILEYTTAGTEDNDDTSQSFLDVLTTAMRKHVSPRKLELGETAGDELPEIVMNCFQYDVEERASAINIIKAFQNLEHCEGI